MGVEDKEKELQLDDIERIKSSLHKTESNLSDITLVEKDEDAGKFFADIDLDKLEEGDVDEFNKVVKDLTDINYEKLSNNDKTEISAMLNRIKEFNFEDIDFEIDPKKIGDMLQNMGGFFIDPYILGTLANYADISGREQAVIVPMLYMDYDEMSNALNNIGKVKLAQTLNGFLSNDDINRDVLDKNIGNLERLFRESDMNHIDDKNIAKILGYLKNTNIKIKKDKKFFKDIDLAKLENGDVEELKKVVKISNTIDYYDLSKGDKAEIKSVLSKIKNFDLENIEVDVDREKIGDILVNIDVEPDMFGVLFRYADIDVSRDNREVIGKVLSFAGLDDDKFEDLLETIDKEKLLTLFTESMYSSTHHVSLERSYSRERIVKLLSNCDMNIMSDTVIGRTINFLGIHKDLGLINKDIVVNVFNKDDVNVGVCFGGYLTDIINKTDISGINFKESVIEDILEQVDLEKIDATKLMDILDKSDMKYLDKDRMKEIENKLVSLGDEKSKGLIEKMNAVQEVSIDELNSISSKRLGNLLKNKENRKFDINDIDNSNLSKALNFLGSEVVDLDERVLTDIFNKKDIDVVECFRYNLSDVINKLDLSKINMDKKMATAIKDEVNEGEIDKDKYRYIEQKSNLSSKNKETLEEMYKRVTQRMEKNSKQEKTEPEANKFAELRRRFEVNKAEKGESVVNKSVINDKPKEVKESKITRLMKNFENNVIVNMLEDGKNTPNESKSYKIRNNIAGDTLKESKSWQDKSIQNKESNNRFREALKHFKEGPNSSYSIKNISKLNKDIIENKTRQQQNKLVANNLSKGAVEARKVILKKSVSELAKRFGGSNEQQKPSVKKGPEK